LEQAKSGGGKAYSVATLNMGRDLKPEELEKVQLIGQAMRELFARTTVQESDLANG